MGRGLPEGRPVRSRNVDDFGAEEALTNDKLVAGDPAGRQPAFG